jgi:tetratricopeptide (TPR) repeat protein
MNKTMHSRRRYGKKLRNVFLGIFFSAALSLSAQITEIKDAFYHVISDGPDASSVLRELELRFDVYNRIFGFDAAALSAPLTVRIFAAKADYDAYVQARLGNVRNGAVYLHYTQSGLRELVIHRGSPEEADALPHQAFIQYLRAFVPYPPAWIQDGFAVFFSSLRTDPGQDAALPALEYTENLAWLDSVKNLGDAAPSLESVLRAGGRDLPDYFQPVAWSVVSFFLNSGVDIYSRTLTEIFMTLDPTASAQANTEAVMRRVTLRTDMDAFRRDYHSYLAARKSFGELIRDGQAAYTRKEASIAEPLFREAENLNPRHYAPYYYLGLLAYERKDYDDAEAYFRSALQYGADPALLNFARGLNAALAGRTAEAAGFLEAAARASPTRYRQKSDDIIRKLK